MSSSHPTTISALLAQHGGSIESVEASGDLTKWYEQQQQLETRATAVRRAPSDELSRIEICEECQGHRVVKITYNFTVNDQTCPTCDGDGVVRRKQVASIQATTNCVQTA
ncbi:TPA: hypothetical protein N0F65_002781 [Lagenidium giganteum]|uniref:Uncharacterized protein n=1 Tax=Lagenidium giganteum TaxID=4803 RepID=A0AAV2YJ80_9STRA|nr:TPA: hypothetical protein N0F65_002781 [Lagenidium giganteum]